MPPNVDPSNLLFTPPTLFKTFKALILGLTVPNGIPPKKPAAAASPNCFANSLLLNISSKPLPASNPPPKVVNVSCIASAKPSSTPTLPTSVANLPTAFPFFMVSPFIRSFNNPSFTAFAACSLPPNTLTKEGTTPPIPSLSAAAYGIPNATAIAKFGSSVSSACAKYVSPKPNIKPDNNVPAVAPNLAPATPPPTVPAPGAIKVPPIAPTPAPTIPNNIVGKLVAAASPNFSLTYLVKAVRCSSLFTMSSIFSTRGNSLPSSST